MLSRGAAWNVQKVLVQSGRHPVRELLAELQPVARVAAEEGNRIDARLPIGSVEEVASHDKLARDGVNVMVGPSW